MIQWLAALIISSATVAISVFILEIVTAPQSSILAELAIVEAHTEHQPSISDLSTEELVRDFSFALLFFTIFTTPVISLIAIVPALIVSAIWESSENFPPLFVYAIGGMMTGLAFSFIAISPLAPLGQSFFTDPNLTPLRFTFLGTVAGFFGGLVMGWRRRSYFQLFLQRQKAK